MQDRGIYFALIVLISLLVIGCGGSVPPESQTDLEAGGTPSTATSVGQSVNAVTVAPTSAPAIATATLPPTAVPTFTPAPTSTQTPFAPSLAGTPVASGTSPISIDNAQDVVEVARWGKGAVQALAFSRDGATVAAGTSLGLYLYEANTGEVKVFWPTVSGIRDVAYSLDGQSLIVVLADDSIVRWNTETGAVLDAETFVAPADATSLRELSPDGELLAFAVGAMIQLVDTSDWSTRVTLEGHSDNVYAVDFSVDGTLLVSTSVDRTTRVWRTDTGASLISVAREYVGTSAVSPDNSLLAIMVGHSDSAVDIVSIADGTLLQTIPTHALEGLDMAFSADGSHLITVSSEGPISTWRVADGSLISSSDGTTVEALGPAISPVGAEYAALLADGTIAVSAVPETEARTNIHGHLPSVMSMDVFAKEGLLAYTGYTSDPRILRITDGSEYSMPSDSGLRSTYLRFVAGGQTLAAMAPNTALSLWRVADGDLLGTTEGRPGFLVGASGQWRALAVSPDGTLLATSPMGGIVHLWSADNGSLVRDLVNSSEPADDVSLSLLAFSPDGSVLAVGPQDATVRLWSVTDGKAIASLEAVGAKVYDLQFSPDGALLLAGSDSGVDVWSTKTWESVQALENITSPVGRIAFSTDGSVLMVHASDGVVSLWHTADWSEIGILKNINQGRVEFAFSPDSSVLATASGSELQLWNLRDASLLAELGSHSSSVTGIAFVDQGAQLVTSSGDGTIRLWGLLQ